MLRLVTVCHPAKAVIFYSGHPDVCTAIIIITYYLYCAFYTDVYMIKWHLPLFKFREWLTLIFSQHWTILRFVHVIRRVTRVNKMITKVSLSLLNRPRVVHAEPWIDLCSINDLQIQAADRPKKSETGILSNSRCFFFLFVFSSSLKVTRYGITDL